LFDYLGLLIPKGPPQVHGSPSGLSDQVTINRDLGFSMDQATQY
jgi:hypothetical protein